MQYKAGIFGIVAMLMARGWAAELSYEDSINALAYGNVALQGDSSDSTTPGEVWLNVTGFAVNKLPYIQHDLGIMSLDNPVPLEIIADLAKTAAGKGKWGDLVFLYNVFSMNAFEEYAKVTSEQMQYGLLVAVTGKNNTKPDISLIDLYASTSSSVYLSDAFNSLKTESKSSKRWTSEFCSSAHRAASSACQSLIQSITGSVTVKTGGPRSICRSGCCISWSANATFQYQNLTNAANYCMSLCATANVSCEVRGVSLQGTILDQCLSNRANGCT